VSGWRTKFLLVAFFAALLVYVLETGKPGARAPEAPSGALPPLLASAAAPARLEISTARQQIIAAATPEGWRLTPEAGAAEEVDALLAALRSLRPLLTVDPSPQDPGDYGLGAAADRLRLLDDGGTELLDLEIGARNPSWTGVYVRRQGSPEVLLVGGVLRWELSKVLGNAP